ncbi:TetR/AcrR family transcriptional regulator [Rhodococcus kronopolitis]|uniref:TetR/AcrR family transcriptional regulator n=1 Tax=Rhodococcus kronopolitis TaxID=1460226 RepID=A0ABV9FP87_9NOCA
MGTRERKDRERQDRERRIVECARRIAEDDGWPAVTTRRLADAIEYSPPVLYGHFPEGRDGIVNAVALDGFRDFVRAMTQATEGVAESDRLTVFVRAYLRFAAEHPATYEAMFSMRLAVRFADASTPPELREAFAVLASAVGATSTQDAGTRAEVFWSALHGMCVLARGQRLAPENEALRVAVLAELFG